MKKVILFTMGFMLMYSSAFAGVKAIDNFYLTTSGTSYTGDLVNIHSKATDDVVKIDNSGDIFLANALSVSSDVVYYNGIEINTTNTFMGQFTRDISSIGAQAITGVGFTPSKVFFIYHRNSEVEFGSGWMNSAAQRAHYWDSGTSNYYTTSSSAIAIAINDATTDAKAAYTSLDSDGFTVTWAKTGSPTGDAYINYIAFN